jgi:nitrogen fixation NifU-like protein
MSLKNLYQELILKHFKQPHHFGPVTDEEAMADGENPTCGDRFRLVFNAPEGKIESIRFDGKGCAISTASCSLMTEAVIGLTLEEARHLAETFAGRMKDGEELPDDYGDLRALEGVQRFPLRVNCATLCWKALLEALEQG